MCIIKVLHLYDRVKGIGLQWPEPFSFNTIHIPVHIKYIFRGA